MLDVGWTEILVIAIVLIIVVGPKDLPQMLRTFGRMVAKMRGMASDFRQQFDEALREADLEDVRKTLGEAQKLNPLNSIRDAVNPLRQMGNEIKADLERKPGSAKTAASAPAESVSQAPAAIPSEAQVPASTEPVAAAPLKKGPTRKTAAKKPAETAAKAGKATKAAATKAETGKKAAARPVARKAASTKAATTKTRKGDA